MTRLLHLLGFSEPGRAITCAVIVAGLAIAGLAGNLATGTLWGRIRAAEPALNLGAIEGGLGRGLTVALFGGFRAVIADFFWLVNSSAWERRDLARSTRLIQLTSAIDPRPLTFWINGARMMAYDMPVWRIEARGTAVPPVADEQRRIEAEQAAMALNHLDAGLVHHPENPQLLIEKANIHLQRLRNPARAAVLYREAALRPGAPPYAARIYAELLRKLDRPQEALEWLKSLHPKLNPSDINDLEGVVRERIRKLEDHLNVPPSRRYRPQGESEPDTLN